MGHPIERRGPEDLVGREAIVSVGEVQVAGDDRRAALVALGEEIVEVLVVRRAQGA